MYHNPKLIANTPIIISDIPSHLTRFIFSPKYEEIADFINSEFGRGVTALNGTGWYTQNNVKVLITIVRKKETSVLFRKVKEIDPDAFISMASVMGVYGQGFDKIKG